MFNLVRTVFLWVLVSDGAIIGMCTTVSKNFNNYEIVVGSGQRVIGQRDQKNFEMGLNSRDFYAERY